MYDINVIEQRGGHDCLLTAIRMLVRDAAPRFIDAKTSSVFDAQTRPDLSSISPQMYRRWMDMEYNPETQKAFIEAVQPKYGKPNFLGVREGGWPIEDMQKFLRNYDLVGRYIEESPQGWQNALRDIGPFVYPRTAHAVLITGLEINYTELKYFVHFNDPDGGVRKKEEFSEFLNKRPASRELQLKVDRDKKGEPHTYTCVWGNGIHEHGIRMVR
jgi:hypothetical protein